MTFATLLDFAASLALLAILAASYGAIRRRIVGGLVATALIGALFGLMALVQIHRPMVPFDGLMIDMRNVPIALAGAFLGWRGLLPCLGIAVAARLGIGGAGMMAGISGMIIAGLAGMIWARKTAGNMKRNFGMLVFLALAMSTHLLAAVILPRDMALWFFTEAAGPILALNLIAIPCVGALLERENRKIAQELDALAAMADGPDAPLRGPAFLREMAAAFAAQPFGTFTGALVIRERKEIWRALTSTAGRRMVDLSPVLKRLVPHLEHGQLAGSTLDGALVLPLTSDEMRRGEAWIDGLREIATGGTRGHRRGRGRLPFDVEFDVIATPDPTEFLCAVEDIVLHRKPAWGVGSDGKVVSPLRSGTISPLKRAQIFDPAEHNALFAKADFLMSRSGS